MVYKLLEMISYRFDIFTDLFDVKIRAVLFLSVFSIKFDQIWVIKITYLLKAGLENVPFNIFIYFSKGLQFLYNLKANLACTELSKLLGK